MSSYKVTAGSPTPFGATKTPAGINFSIFSRHAEKVWLLLYDKRDPKLYTRIPLDPRHNKTGNVWHILVRKLDPAIPYAFKVAGPHDPRGSGHAFDKEAILLDPYARALIDGEQWSDPASGFARRCQVTDINFDWQGDRPLKKTIRDTIIYEMHVRGFTRHESSGVNHPGTYAGIVEKIPYLQKLGITAVELMPVTEFNENENTRVDPTTGKGLKNFWGYSPLSFFAPKASYAAHAGSGNQVREFKEMVNALHQAGIEVFLDVVFNHTAEASWDGPTISFRGLDNTVYYLLDPVSRDYLNFSGCGNTLNCNHPLVRQLILDCLHYWVMEMHVDGFRFDLASILGRDQNGEVLSNPPMVEIIAEDPILADTKIIAEAWDAAGLYQVGSFSRYPRWAEWNGRFRDDVRAFMCGRENTVASLATRIAGSSDLYQRSDLRPFNSINFIASHDGFTLHDLVSYNEKHNRANGEENRDGMDDNISWNSGVEGKTTRDAVRKMRNRRMRTFAVILFLSQGVPMLAAGDEFGRTQQGNNNAYCHDNDISWLDWRLLETNSDLFRFFRLLIQLRKDHAVFRRTDFFPPPGSGGSAGIVWQAERPGSQNWSPDCRHLAFFLDGTACTYRDDDFFIMLNGDRQKTRLFVIPPARKRRTWRKIIDTAAPPPADIMPEPGGSVLEPKAAVKVAPMGAVVLISRRPAGKRG